MQDDSTFVSGAFDEQSVEGGECRCLVELGIVDLAISPDGTNGTISTIRPQLRETCFAAHLSSSDSLSGSLRMSTSGFGVIADG